MACHAKVNILIISACGSGISSCAEASSIAYECIKTNDHNTFFYSLDLAKRICLTIDTTRNNYKQVLLLPWVETPVNNNPYLTAINPNLNLFPITSLFWMKIIGPTSIAPSNSNWNIILFTSSTANSFHSIQYNISTQIFSLNILTSAAAPNQYVVINSSSIPYASFKGNWIRIGFSIYYSKAYLFVDYNNLFDSNYNNSYYNSSSSSKTALSNTLNFNQVMYSNHIFCLVERMYIYSGFISKILEYVYS